MRVINISKNKKGLGVVLDVLMIPDVSFHFPSVPICLPGDVMRCEVMGYGRIGIPAMHMKYFPAIEFTSPLKPGGLVGRREIGQ